MADAGKDQKLKIFISYARSDSSDFADELVAGLELAGFEPFLDRHDIVAGEDWEARLAGLIHQADTV
ncbi:MAG: toll/interleukin-1 receptor domain-containing protein, partial [Tardiphaga sp.]